MVLEEGPVLEQLEWAFEDVAIANYLVAEYELPVELPGATYWQLPLTSNQVHNHHRSKLAVLFRAVGLLR